MASATSTAPSISDLRSWIHELRENLGVLKEILARSEQSAGDWASKRRQGGRWPEFALRDLICELADGYEDLTKGEARGGPFVGFVRSVLVTIEPDEPRYALNRTVARHLKWRADRRAGQQIEGERNRGA